MVEKIINAVKYGEELLKNDNAEEIAGKLEYFRRQIAIFQHERLIHLIVTVTFAIIAFMCMIMLMINMSIPLVVLFGLFFIMTGAYIRHYYYLENCTQRLYDIYEEMEEKAKNIILVNEKHFR